MATQLISDRPPSSLAIVGMEVATIVMSSDPRNSETAIETSTRITRDVMPVVSWFSGAAASFSFCISAFSFCKVISEISVAVEFALSSAASATALSSGAMAEQLLSR